MTGVTGNIYAGLHEFVDMAFVLHLLQRGDCFFDVGANVGSYTILASAICGAFTYAFDPDPDTAIAFRKNIAANNIQNYVTLVEAAVGEKGGPVFFTVGRDTVNRIADNEEKAMPVRVVRMTTLDEVDSECPVLVKIDIEAYEEQALRGAARLLGDRRLRAIALETANEGAQSVLAHAGFVRRYYDPIKRLLSPEPTRYHQSNALYVRDPDAIQAMLTAAPRRYVYGTFV
jgi:FkbM family methyltransferase